MSRSIMFAGNMVYFQDINFAVLGEGKSEGYDGRDAFS